MFFYPKQMGDYGVPMFHPQCVPVDHVDRPVCVGGTCQIGGACQIFDEESGLSGSCASCRVNNICCCCWCSWCSSEYRSSECRSCTNLVVVVLVVLVSAMSAIIIRLSLSLAIQTISYGSQDIFILDSNGFRLPKFQKKKSKSVSFSGLNRLLRQKRNNFEIIQERVSFATGWELTWSKYIS